MKKQLEVCCGSYYDVLQAVKGGAKRVELNSALHLGGLTPSVATLRLCKKNTDAKIISMLRPRGAGFHYEKADFETMVMDCEILLDNGSDGIVFGCLDENGKIDIDANKQLIDIIKAKGKEAVFHRAFDCVEDPFAAIETLIALGVDRVLTSGTYANVEEGKNVLKQLQQKYGEQIQILPGCGVNIKNAKEIIDFTGVSQIHSSCKSWLSDATTISKRVHYAYASGEHASDYEVVDANLVRNLIAAIQ